LASWLLPTPVSPRRTILFAELKDAIFDTVCESVPKDD
jgi:hypothetical protein